MIKFQNEKIPFMRSRWYANDSAMIITFSTVLQISAKKIGAKTEKKNSSSFSPKWVAFPFYMHTFWYEQPHFGTWPQARRENQLVGKFNILVDSKFGKV